MKVLAVSDNVLPQLEKAEFIRRQYGDIDRIISCGDLPAPYLDFIPFPPLPRPGTCRVPNWHWLPQEI